MPLTDESVELAIRHAADEGGLLPCFTHSLRIRRLEDRMERLNVKIGAIVAVASFIASVTAAVLVAWVGR